MLIGIQCVFDLMIFSTYDEFIRRSFHPSWGGSVIGVGVLRDTTEWLSHVLRNTESARRRETKNLLEHVWVCVCVCVHVSSVVSDSCDPMDYSLPGSSVHGISQTRILEWVAISSPRGSFQPRIKPNSPALEGRFFTTKPPGKLLFWLGDSERHGSWGLSYQAEPWGLHPPAFTEAVEGFEAGECPVWVVWKGSPGILEERLNRSIRLQAVGI